MCDDVNANKSLFGNERETPSIRSSRSHGRPSPVISGNASAAGGAGTGSGAGLSPGSRIIGMAGPVIPPIGLTGPGIPNRDEAKLEGTGPLGRVGGKMGKKQQGRREPGLAGGQGERTPASARGPGLVRGQRADTGLGSRAGAC